MCTQPTLELLALEIHYSMNIYRCIYLNNMLFKKKKRICCSVSHTKPTPGDAKRRKPQPVLRKEGRKTLTQTGWDHSSQSAVRSQG